MAAVIGVGACFRPATPPPREYEVDVLEDDAANVVARPGGQAVTIPRAALPSDVREGDVVVDGRVDHALTERLRDDVRTARERLVRVDVSSGSLDLDGPSEPSPEPGDDSPAARVVAEAPSTR